ncbi:MAG TPA: hypothetical protein IAD47_01420 [Candidatus Limihabitans stercoravium]|nr:hypothetical protein [Candidatus Limihabitans stercoravium]
MRKFSLIQSFPGVRAKDVNSENLKLFECIGNNNQYHISKISPTRKVSKNLSFSGMVKLGLLNLQKSLGKSKYSLTLIKKAFGLKEVIEFGNVKHKCQFFLGKSHEVFLKAYDLVGIFNRQFPTNSGKILKEQISKDIAPCHMLMCYTFYNLNSVTSDEVKDYLKMMLKEIEKF